MTIDEPILNLSHFEPYPQRHPQSETGTGHSHPSAKSAEAPTSPSHATLRRTLSLAELEARGSTSQTDAPFTFVSLESEPHTQDTSTIVLQQALHDLSSQLRDRDAQYHLVAEHLANEKKQRELFEQQRNTAWDELDLLKRANHDHEELQSRVDHLAHQLAEKSALVEQTEHRLRRAVEDGEQRVQDIANRLTLESGKLHETLQESLSERDSLGKRCTQLESELNAEKDLSRATETDTGNSSDSDSSLETFSKSFVKKKLFELKIARNVITEKDKVLKESQDDAKRAQTRVDDAEAAMKSSEARTVYLENELNDVKRELASSRDDASTRLILVEELQEELKTMESVVEKAKKDTATAVVAANENEEKRREYKELLESTARRCHEAVAEKQASIAESEKLHESLAAAEQEIARLGGILQGKGNDNSDYLGSTSPCSLVTDADANAQSASSPSRSRPVRSLAELEETASVVTSGSSPVKCEKKQPEHPRSEQESTVESLSKSLHRSRLHCDEKNEQLQEAIATVARQETALKKMNTLLASRKEENEVLENQVRSELTPALHAAKKSLEETEEELKMVREEFHLHREMAERTRSALELEVGSTTERLQETLALLEHTREELSQSQQKVSNLDDQLNGLEERKREMRETFAELEQANGHRLQSLRVMQERLATVELCAAGHQQAIADTTKEKELLEIALAQEADRREVAENRAARKDDLVLELETRTLELERNHAALKEHLTEKTQQLDDTEEDLRTTKEIAQLRDDALREQTSICKRREALFESLTSELKMVIESRNAELQDTKEDLSNLERRLKSVSKCLEEERTKVKSREHELAEMLRKCSDSEAENRWKEAKLSEEAEQYSRLTAEHQAVQQELDAREKQIASHLTSISEKSGKIVGFRAEKTELEKTVQKLRKELDSERGKFESQLATTKQLGEDLTTAQANFATCEGDLSIRNTEVDSLRRSLTNARNELSKMERAIGNKDDKISANSDIISTLEKALERSKHQHAVLESHLDGHDTLLRDNREKDECIAVKSGELNQAKETILQLENEKNILHEKLVSKEEGTASLSREVATLEAGKTSIEEELRRAKKARSIAEKSLNETSASLAALGKSTTEEIADLSATIASLRRVIDEKESSLNSASDTIAQSSAQSNLIKEQLIDSRSRGDRLFSQLTTTEYELASKKEALTTLELKFHEIQEALSEREVELEKMRKTLLLKDQALSSAQSKLDEMGKKANKITQGEFLTMQTKLEAKEKAIANLHNWCCFINGKLHAAEKALSERDMDLEVSSTGFKKLEYQLRKQNEVVSEKELQMRKLESSRAVESSELRSRIHSLQSFVGEAKSELERTKQMMSSKGSEAHSSLIAVSEELVECKANLKSMEKEMSEVVSTKRNLEETTKTYERNLAASERTIECLTLDLGRLQSELNSKRGARDVNDKNAAEEILKVRSETGYLIVELRRAEAELSAANETARSWQQKVEDLQPLAESTLEAQRAVEIVSSQLALLQKESKQRIDLLETQLKEAERERDNADRDCSAAIADYSAMRARLMEIHSRGSAYGRLAAANNLCTVTFVLEGQDAPSADIMVYILGEDAALGQWNPSRRLPVRVTGEGKNGIIRECEVVLPASLSTAYKFAGDGPDGSLVWEAGENRSLHLQGELIYELTDVWRSPN